MDSKVYKNITNFTFNVHNKLYCNYNKSCIHVYAKYVKHKCCWEKLHKICDCINLV